MNNSKKPADTVCFGTFDPNAEVAITERNLPHWFQPGAATFVTFRTADSMPRDVILRWQRELEAWLTVRHLPKELAAFTTQSKAPQAEQLFRQLGSAEASEFRRLSDRLFHQSLDDCHGACLLRRPELAKLVGDAILYHAESQYDLDRFVVMPNHVHVIVQFRDESSFTTVSQS